MVGSMGTLGPSKRAIAPIMASPAMLIRIIFVRPYYGLRRIQGEGNHVSFGKINFIQIKVEDFTLAYFLRIKP